MLKLPNIQLLRALAAGLACDALDERPLLKLFSPRPTLEPSLSI